MSSTVAARSFRHGVHPAEHKEPTGSLPIQRFPFVATYVVPVHQNAGRPPLPVVEKGERVQRGQTIARAQGFISVDLHSPVTGRVTDLGLRRHPSGQLVECFEIEADPFDAQLPPARPPLVVEELTLDRFITQVQQAGLVGLGGAAFPSHVKYKLPEGKRCERLVINGCECEPFLTCDDRTMVERADAVIRGIRIVAQVLRPGRSYIGVELNKPEALAALRRAVGDDVAIQVCPVQVKYPQGAEKMLIEALFGEEVPAGKLPIDIGVVVNNVGTMASLADYVDRGIPLIERAVTVSGDGVERPANLLVPIGTPVRALLEHCGLRPEARQVVMGGPMMGQPTASLDVPVLKGTSGILAFTRPEVLARREYACVRCGLCLDACANYLNPSRLARLARARRYEAMEGEFLWDCMECGACSFACPSGIPIVHLIRTAKAERWAQRAREK